MSTRCVACRNPVKQGQLFCPDCLEKRAPASAQKQERRRRRQLLELILSLPHLSVSERRSLVTTGKKRSGRYKTDIFDVQRRLLALSSSLLGVLVVALALLSLVLLIID